MENLIEQPGPETNLSELPEYLISEIFSFTTPPDVCRLSAVSKLFASAADSDNVWNKFLPQQCQLDHILSKAVSPVVFASKRKLYFRLCDSILIDGGSKIFWLDRSTGKVGCMLSARELSIIWGDDPRYWRFISRDDSRFDLVAELLIVWWFEVRGRIDCRLLSANTEYRVVFVLKFGERPYGFGGMPIKFSITTPDGEVLERTRLLAPDEDPDLSDLSDDDQDVLDLSDDDSDVLIDGLDDPGLLDDDHDHGGLQAEDGSHYDDHGWLQLVVGKFIMRGHGDYDDWSHDIKFCMSEVNCMRSKQGLFIDGVRIEPTIPIVI